jgi:hypothetical protein
MTTKNSLQDWLDQLDKNDIQLNLDLDDNMNGYGAQPALTISSASVDTITLGSGASGTTYDFNYNDTISLTGAAGSPYTFPATNITISNTTGGYGQILSTGINGTWNDFGSTGKPSLKVTGDADFDGDVKIKGKSITEVFDKIEERLAILHPNPELEDRWEELKELSKRYKELEKEIIEKEKMWDILKR